MFEHDGNIYRPKGDKVNGDIKESEEKLPEIDKPMLIQIDGRLSSVAPKGVNSDDEVEVCAGLDKSQISSVVILTRRSKTAQYGKWATGGVVMVRTG